MLNEEQAQTLILKLTELKNGKKSELIKYEIFCMNKFEYLINMHIAKYKKFNNYEDLKQEGFLALSSAIKTYELGKGSFFFWAHKYIKTRIQRKANQHCTIRYPLLYSKQNVPHYCTLTPSIIEKARVNNSENRPDIQYEMFEIKALLDKAQSKLSDKQKEILSLTFGLQSESESMTKICEKYHISSNKYNKLLNNALKILKNNIDGDI